MKLFSFVFIYIMFLTVIISSNEILAQQQDTYLPFAEVMPQPEGGITAIYKNITYPDIAKRAGIEGKVYLLVYINKNGGVDKVNVIKSLGAGCDEAAVKGIESVKFTPGEDKGVPVKVKLSLAITFKLQQ